MPYYNIEKSANPNRKLPPLTSPRHRSNCFIVDAKREKSNQMLHEKRIKRMWFHRIHLYVNYVDFHFICNMEWTNYCSHESVTIIKWTPPNWVFPFHRRKKTKALLQKKIALPGLDYCWLNSRFSSFSNISRFLISRDTLIRFKVEDSRTVEVFGKKNG